MKQILLFSLDLLLDTRLPVLGQIDPTLPSAIMSDPEKNLSYRNRLNDVFTDFGLTDGVFEKAWNKRDIRALMSARPTKFLFELSAIAQQLINKSVIEPQNVEEIEFHINFYPYIDLTDNERELIVAAIKARVQDWVIFKGVFIPDPILTGEYIRSAGYTGIFFYDFRNWLNYQYGANVAVNNLQTMPSISVYTTLMFNNTDSLQEAMDFRNPNGEGCNPLLGLRAMFAPYFFLEGLDTGAVCIIPPDEVADQTGI